MYGPEDTKNTPGGQDKNTGLASVAGGHQQGHRGSKWLKDSRSTPRRQEKGLKARAPPKTEGHRDKRRTQGLQDRRTKGGHQVGAGHASLNRRFRGSQIVQGSISHPPPDQPSCHGPEAKPRSSDQETSAPTGPPDGPVM